MKKYNLLKVILLTIFVVVVLSWVLPSISFSSELTEAERIQFGLFDFNVYLVDILRYFPYLVLSVLAIAMFYGVVYKIPAYRELLDKIATKSKGKEKIVLSVIMALIAIIVSVSGLNFGILFVFPFVISLVLLMGYNKLVATLVTVGSTMVGIMGTTFGANTTVYINYVLGTDSFSELSTKIVILVSGLIVVIYNALFYAGKTKNGVDAVKKLVPKSKKETVKEEKVEVKEEKKESKNSSKKDSKKTTKKSNNKKSTKTRANDLKDSNNMVVKANKKQSILPLIIIFDLTLLVIVLGTIDWVNVFNVNVFSDCLTSIQKLKIGDFEIFAKILGDVKAFGEWSMGYEIPTTIVLSTIILAFVYGFSFDDFFDGCKDGLNKAYRIVLYMCLAYMVLIISTYNPVQLHFAKFFMNLTNGFNVITTTIVAMIASVLNIETTYVAQSTLPYITTVAKDSEVYPLIAVIFQSVYGLVMLIAPTSVVLIGTLVYLDVSYTQWIKHVWKLFLELLLVLVIIFLIVFLV